MDKGVLTGMGQAGREPTKECGVWTVKGKETPRFPSFQDFGMEVGPALAFLIRLKVPMSLSASSPTGCPSALTPCHKALG